VLTEGARKVYRGRQGARGHRVGQGWYTASRETEVWGGGVDEKLASRGLLVSYESETDRMGQNFP
jgi:hypothetical protein